MKHLLVMLLLLCSAVANAQDVIVKKDGSAILSKVLEVGQNEIKYKRHDNLDGPTYTISKSEVQAINYQNGAKDTFSAPVREENRYLPNNQNDGVQQYNDKALLSIDYNMHKDSRKVKIIRTIGWIGGPVLIGAGLLLSTARIGEYNYDLEDPTVIGLMGGGVIWTSGFLFAAHMIKKNEQKGLQSSTIYHYNFKITDSSSLSTGIDMLSDHSIGNKTFGLGLRYNF